MRRVAMAALIAFVAAGGSTTTLAQSPSPSPEHWGQRVEVPEAGFALTVPDEWQVGIRSISAGLTGLGWGPEVQRAQVLTTLAPGRLDVRTCSVFRYQDTGLTVQAFVARIVGWLTGPENQFGWSGVTRPAPVALPAGEAIVIDVESDLVQRPGVDVVLASGDAIFVLACRRTDGADPDVLSIAESFEFLPTEEQAEPP